MTLQTFADSSTENFAAKVGVYQVSMSGRRWDALSFGRLVIWITEGYNRLKAAVGLTDWK